MQALRALLFANRHVAAIVMAAALCLKALIPAGYMPDIGAQALTIEICADSTSEHLTRLLVVPHKGIPAADRHDGAACACPFSSLVHQCLSGVDPILLMVAVAAIMVLGVAAQTPAPRHSHRHLRPPLRGPPVPV